MWAGLGQYLGRLGFVAVVNRLMVEIGLLHAAKHNSADNEFRLVKIKQWTL